MPRPLRFLVAFALAALIACDQASSTPHAFTGGGFNPPGGFVPRGDLSPQGGGFVPFPWFRIDGGSVDAAIDAPSTTTMTVAITDSADPVITGADAYSYSVALTNSGSIAATTVSVATTIDSSLTIVSASGTGWSCSAVGQVETCTRATAAVGAQPAITINVTTGTSAVAASSSVVASAANASNATASQGTTVQLVSKDATAGIYFPATSTEWSNFIARKGLNISPPDALWLCQEASGNLADSIGSFTLTASGTGLSYQNTLTGFSRKSINFTEASTGAFTTTSASLPNIATQSQFLVAVAKVTAPTSSTRQLLLMGGSGTTSTLGMTNATSLISVSSAGNSANGTVASSGSVQAFGLRNNRTASTTTGFSGADKKAPTFGTTISGQRAIIGAGSNPTMNVVYAWQWNVAHAEIGDADYKATLLAMGLPATF